jgi:hypothetical protein
LSSVENAGHTGLCRWQEKNEECGGDKGKKKGIEKEEGKRKERKKNSEKSEKLESSIVLHARTADV